MTDGVHDWMTRLREYAAACRTVYPLPSRGALSKSQEWQCRIVGGALLNWLREDGPRFLQERAFMGDYMGLEPEPAIVFTSDISGLVAAQQIVGPEHERIVYLLEEEFSVSAPHLDDPTYNYHLHCWSVFRAEVSADLAASAFAKYPLPTGCVYWTHSEGTRWGVNAARGCDHLWRWDGTEPKLLEEAISQWVS